MKILSPRFSIWIWGPDWESLAYLFDLRNNNWYVFSRHKPEKKVSYMNQYFVYFLVASSQKISQDSIWRWWIVYCFPNDIRYSNCIQFVLFFGFYIEENTALLSPFCISACLVGLTSHLFSIMWWFRPCIHILHPLFITYLHIHKYFSNIYAYLSIWWSLSSIFISTVVGSFVEFQGPWSRKK